MIKDFKKNILVVKYVFKFCPLYIFFTLFYIVANVIQVLQKVYLIEAIVDLVETCLSSNGDITQAFEQIVLKLVVYFIIMFVTSAVKTYYTSYVMQKYRTIYINKMQRLMFEKAKLIDYADFDNPVFYDMYSRALRDGTFRGIRVYEDFTSFISAIANTIALGTFIVISDPILIAVILFSVIVRILIANKVNKNIHKYDTETEIDRRMYGYVNRTFYQQRFAAEIKTTPISELLIDNCIEAQNNIDKKYIQTYKKNTILNSLSSVVSNAFEHGGIYVYLVYQLFRGLSISSFSSMITAASQFSSNFYEAASFFNRLKLNSLYIDYFLDYMNYKPKLENIGKEDIDEEFRELKFDDVTFSYPNTEVNALSNINLHIKKGEKLAIVGLNGAGKTTLIKLLLKFYNPNSGKIYYNDHIIENVKEDVIRRKYSIIFQDYRLYGVTLGENILMRKMETEEDEQKVWEALEKVGLKEKILSLPQNIHTIYSREFGSDGVSFSGGEQQRVAIARVFASDADIYVLDEPTSNLDPLAERDINKLIIEKSKDKTIIIIAHRLSTVVDTDRIILLEYGKIIEDGNHHELLKLNGKYCEMFTTQATLYHRNNSHQDNGKPLFENGNGFKNGDFLE